MGTAQSKNDNATLDWDSVSSADSREGFQ